MVTDESQRHNERACTVGRIEPQANLASATNELAP